MDAVAARERHRQILHKRYGWLEAPDGCYFEPSENGKTVWLVDPGEGMRQWRFPFGTYWHATSILAYADPVR